MAVVPGPAPARAALIGLAAALLLAGCKAPASLGRFLLSPTPTDPPSLATPFPTALPSPSPTPTLCMPLPDALAGPWITFEEPRSGLLLALPASFGRLGDAGPFDLTYANHSGVSNAVDCGPFELYIRVDPVESWVGSQPDENAQTVRVAGTDGTLTERDGQTRVLFSAHQFVYAFTFTYQVETSTDQQAARDLIAEILDRLIVLPAQQPPE